MTEFDKDIGLDRRRYDRFSISRQVDVVARGKTYAGTLRDISIGGAAVRLRGPVEAESQVTLDIYDFGVFRGDVLRHSADETIAVEFEIDEKQSVDLAAKLVAVYYGVGGAEQRDAAEVEWHSLTP